jgi:hypothetical protein
MAFVFRDPQAFLRESFWTAASAAALGAVVAPPSWGFVPVASGAAALLGASLAAVLTRRPRPGQTPHLVLRGIAGAFLGLLTAVGFSALAFAGGSVAMVGGFLAGAALAALLGLDEPARHRRGKRNGLIGAGVAGALGVLALQNANQVAMSEGLPLTATTAGLAGLFALWMTAGAGVRRIQGMTDPLREQAEDLQESVPDPVRTKVRESTSAWAEIEGALGRDDAMVPSMKAEATDNTRRLVQGVLEAARAWGQIHDDLKSPRVAAVNDRLHNLGRRLEATSDDMTRTHLVRALTALHAQKAAVDGLKVGMERAEAALDAQLALLERLRLAIAQHRVSDRERFSVELTAVAELAGRLSDDLDTLASAIAEAEVLADRRALADVERNARRLLSIGADAPACAGASSVPAAGTLSDQRVEEETVEASHARH